jgi:hypothetical protein
MKGKSRPKHAEPTLHGAPIALPNRHMCGFFRGAQEQYRYLLPFIKEGLERGEQAVHVVRGDLHEPHLNRLKSFGIDAERALESGQLKLLGWEDTYLSKGRFEMTKMPRLIKQLIAESRKAGYPLLRYVGNMEWSLQDCPGVEDVMEYESKLQNPKSPSELSRPGDLLL